MVGDIAARRLTRTAQEAARQVRLGAARAGENLAEYLLEEDPQLVRPRQVRALADAVRTLRDDLARLEKRIERQGRT